MLRMRGCAVGVGRAVRRPAGAPLPSAFTTAARSSQRRSSRAAPLRASSEWDDDDAPPPEQDAVYAPPVDQAQNPEPQLERTSWRGGRRHLALLGLTLGCVSRLLRAAGACPSLAAS